MNISNNPFECGNKLKTGFDYFAKGFNKNELVDAFYHLIADRRQGQLLLECAEFCDVDEMYNPGEEIDDEADRLSTVEGIILEAVRVKAYARTAQTMAALQKVLNKHLSGTGKDITAGDAIIGKPKKNGLFASVTVQFPLTDGQTLSIIFHSPDNNKMKITAADEIIAFRWLLNKRDITSAVSPDAAEEGNLPGLPAAGKDVSLEEVGTRCAQLIIKNSDRFAAKSADLVAAKKLKEELNAQVSTLQDGNGQLQQDLAAKIYDSEQNGAKINATQRQIEKQIAYNEELRARLEGLKATGAGNGGKGAGERMVDWETKPPYSDEYSGPRFKYGFINRPYGMATAPKGSILMTYKADDKPETSKGKARYGTIEYPFQLTSDEIYSYELLDLTGTAESEDAETFKFTEAYFKDELRGRGFVAGTDGSLSQNTGEGNGIDANLFDGADGYTVRVSASYADPSKSEQKEFASKTLAGLDKQIADALKWIDKKIGEMKKPSRVKIDPTTPEGYAAITGNKVMEERYQDGLDSLFVGRAIDARNALRDLGWIQNGEAFFKGNTGVTFDFKKVGAGGNVVGVTASIFDKETNMTNDQFIKDDLTQTPEEIAKALDAFADSNDVQAKAIAERELQQSARNAEVQEELRLTELGKTAVPGVRPADAKEAGVMYELLQKGEIQQAEWDVYAADLYASKKATQPEPAPDTNPDRAEENAALTILDDIMGGKYADSTEISDRLDEAANTLEKLGMMDLYDERLNAAADYLTGVLKTEAAGV